MFRNIDLVTSLRSKVGHTSNGESYRLLIIDNEEPVRTLIRTLIPRGLGIVVCGEAADGIEALDVYRRQSPDIVITDIRMPGMDGLTLLENLSPRVPACQVIVVSGFNEFAYAQKAIDQGVIAYLLKPIDESALYQVLKKAIDTINRQLETVDQISTMQRELNKLQNSLGESAHEERPMVNAESPIIAMMIKLIEENYNRDISLGEIARRMYMSPAYLSRLFKEKTGHKFVDILLEVRMSHAKALLLRPELRVNEIAGLVGYRDVSHFIEVFRKWTGMTPNDFRRQTK